MERKKPRKKVSGTPHPPSFLSGSGNRTVEMERRAEKNRWQRGREATVGQNHRPFCSPVRSVSNPHFSFSLSVSGTPAPPPHLTSSRSTLSSCHGEEEEGTAQTPPPPPQHFPAKLSSFFPVRPSRAVTLSPRSPCLHPKMFLSSRRKKVEKGRERRRGVGWCCCCCCCPQALSTKMFSLTTSGALLLFPCKQERRERAAGSPFSSVARRT